MQEGTKRLNIVISNNLHRNLKIEVAKQGITITQFVAEAITEKIERQKGDKDKRNKKKSEVLLTSENLRLSIMTLSKVIY